MIDVLPRYIATRFVLTVTWTFVIVSAVIVLGNLLELIRSNEGRAASFAQLLTVALLQTPGIALTVTPFVLMLASLATFARLARGSELVVIRASGVSAWRIVAPAVVAAIAMGVIWTTLGNPIAAAATQRAEVLKARYTGSAERLGSLTGAAIWLRQGDGNAQTVIHARQSSERATLLRDVTIFTFERDGDLVGRIDAAEARLTPRAWVLTDAVVRDLSGDGEGFALGEVRRQTLEQPTDMTPDQIADSFEPPEAISFWRLPQFIANLKAAGFSAARHELYWQSQIAAPVMFAGMAMIGAAFSMRHARLGGLGLMALGAVLTGFAMYFVSDVAKAMGSSGAAPVVLAAWAPPLAAVLMAAGLLLHLEDG
ncbi:MAG: LPS export ABC transporter permease LptG [Rubrimonas sp.]